MKTLYPTICLVAVLFMVCNLPTGATAQTVKQTGKPGDVKNITWEAYDSTSIVAKNKITAETLGGFWKAGKEVYRFGAYSDVLELTRPALIEVIGKTYRRDIEQPLAKYTLNNNLIIQPTETGADTGVINKITLHELTISWKSKGNYTRFYYKK